MLKIHNQNQMLGVAYSGKGHLVFMFYPTKGQRLSNVCYYTSEMAYNSKILKIAADSIISDEASTKEWLKSITLKFTTADGGFIYISFTDDSIIFRNFNQQGQEIYSFVAPFDIGTLIAMADYLSQWANVQALIDAGLSSQSQNRRTSQQNNQYGGNRGYQQNPVQYNQQPMNYGSNMQQPHQPMNYNPQMPSGNSIPAPQQTGYNPQGGNPTQQQPIQNGNMLPPPDEIG